MTTDSSKIDLGEWIIIVMIGIEILLAVGTIGLTVHEANSQAGILSSILTAQTRIDTDLNNMNTKLAQLDTEMATTAGAVTKSSETSSEMNKALRSQLRILAEEQRQQSEQLSRTPRIVASVGNVPLSSTNLPLKSKEFSATKAVYEIVLQNTGDLSLIGGMLRIAVDNPKIHVTTTNSYSPILVPEALATTGNGIQVPLGRLNKGTWTLIVMELDYPEGTQPFHVSLTIDGDNFALTQLGGMTITTPTVPKT